MSSSTIGGLMMRRKNASQSATFVVAASNSLHPERADYVCDGVDDQVEIQAAIDAAYVAGGGKVSVLDGTYNITGNINLKSFSALFGQGAGTILKVPDNTNSTHLKIINIEDCAYVHVSDLKIDGNKANQSSGREDGIYIKGLTSHVKITNLFIYNIYGVEGNGIFVEDVPYDISIRGNTVNHIQDDGMDVNGMTHSEVVGNYIHDCGDNGIDTEGAEYTTFVGNVIYDCGGSGLELEQEGSSPPLCRYCTVTGNSIKSCGIDGIHARSGGYNSITGNTIVSCDRHGIYLANAGGGGGDAEYNVVVGNLIIDNTHEGIYEESGQADYNFYSGNYLKSNGGYQILISGLHSQAINNYWEDDYHSTAVESNIKLYHNYTANSISAGSVVVLEKSIRTYAIDTTTTKGDDLVLGVALDTIASDATGFILLEGRTTLLKVNGTDDIAEGDFLATYTEAGIACKAGSGDMAFGIALEAYTSDDSNGVIDTLVISPRKI